MQAVLVVKIAVLYASGLTYLTYIVYIGFLSLLQP